MTSITYVTIPIYANTHSNSFHAIVLVSFIYMHKCICCVLLQCSLYVSAYEPALFAINNIAKPRSY